MRFRLVSRISWLLVLSSLLAACDSLPTGTSSDGKSTAFKLPPLPVARDAVELELVLIDRPVSDPLLGKSLWREVDQVGGLSLEQRAAVRHAGLQVGQVGSTPPDALQSLMNLVEDEREQQRREANGIPKTTAKRIVLPTGTDSEIWTNEPLAVLPFQMPNGKSRELTNVRGLLRMRAERTQDGWVRLDFVPELHHGQTSTRPFAAATGWIYRTAQEVLPLYDARFSAHLSVGEMLVLSADRDRSESLGQQLFQFEDTTGKKQRVVVIRVAEMREITPVRVKRDRANQ